jgi:lipoprotein-releasing system permease protein
MGFNFFIAKRIYSSNSGDFSFSRPSVMIATAGIAVGIVVMIISVSVVFGFKREISGKVIGFGSHIQIRSHTVDENHIVLPVTTDDKLSKLLSKTPGISYYQNYAAIPGLVKTDEDFCAINIKGVGEEYDFTFFEKYIIKGRIPFFSSKSSKNQILISSPIASEMKIDIGEAVYVYFINEQSQKIRARKFTVSGIYQTHLEEFDKLTCFTDIYTIRRLNNWDNNQSSGVEIMVEDIDKADNIVNYLSQNSDFKIDDKGYERGVYKIQDLSPHIFAWLDVLDMNVIMILILMLAIGGFTVMAGLLIVMLDRIQMIGILRSLGTNNLTIRKIFSYFAILIVGKGLLIGDIIGTGLCFIQKYGSIVKLNPSTYYIDSVPIEMNWLYILLINIGVLFISSLVIFGSSFLMSIKAPSSTIRWE